MAESNEPSELVVEDKPVVHRVVPRVLRGKRFRAIETEEGWELLHRLGPQVPLDLLVLVVTSLHKHKPVRHPR